MMAVLLILLLEPSLNHLYPLFLYVYKTRKGPRREHYLICSLIADMNPHDQIDQGIPTQQMLVDLAVRSLQSRSRPCV
jgi:hypothetical protein